jgi:hypothetical protein
MEQLLRSTAWAEAAVGAAALVEADEVGPGAGAGARIGEGAAAGAAATAALGTGRIEKCVTTERGDVPEIDGEAATAKATSTGRIAGDEMIVDG